MQGSRQIARELDRLRPEPPLFPADPEQRAAVEEAERFGDEELQHPIRQMLWWGFKQDRCPLRSYSEGARLGIPIGLAMQDRRRRSSPSRPASTKPATRTPGAPSRRCRPCSTGSTPGSRTASLDGEQLNAADFQIAPSWAWR